MSEPRLELRGRAIWQLVATIGEGEQWRPLIRDVLALPADTRQRQDGDCPACGYRYIKAAERRAVLAEVREYCQHTPQCAVWRCRRCGAELEADVHYRGTVDSHPAETQSCTCGLDARIAE